ARRNRGQGNGQRRLRNPARPGHPFRTPPVPWPIRDRRPEGRHGRLCREAAGELEGTLVMARIAFIGLGHMGGGMAPNLVKAGHEVRAFDLSAEALAHAEEGGCVRAGSTEDAVKDAEAVVTMLPAGKHVAEIYRSHIFGNAPTSALLVDCSTIDVATARSVE